MNNLNYRVLQTQIACHAKLKPIVGNYEGFITGQQFCQLPAGVIKVPAGRIIKYLLRNCAPDLDQRMFWGNILIDCLYEMIFNFNILRKQ